MGGGGGVGTVGGHVGFLRKGIGMKLLFEDSHKCYTGVQKLLTIDRRHFSYDLISAANSDSLGLYEHDSAVDGHGIPMKVSHLTK